MTNVLGKNADGEWTLALNQCGEEFAKISESSISSTPCEILEALVPSLTAKLAELLKNPGMSADMGAEKIDNAKGIDAITNTIKRIQELCCGDCEPDFAVVTPEPDRCQQRTW